MKNRRKECRIRNKHSRSGYFVCCLLMCISLFLTACEDSVADNNVNNAADNNQTDNISGENNTASAAGTAQQPEYVYVPELITIKDNRIDYGRMQQVGDSVCYISLNGEVGDEVNNICLFSLTDKELSRIPVNWPMEGKYREVGGYVFEQDHSVWVIANVYPADYSHLSRYLCKFDSEGKNLFSKEITDQIGRDSSIGIMATDRQRRLYVFTSEYDDEAGIWLYTADGDYQGYISYNSLGSVQVKGTADVEDGRFYVCVSEKADPDHCTLMEVDFEKGQITELAENFPNINGMSVDPTGQYDLLMYDDVYAYGYDFSEQNNKSRQAAEELFVWGDSDVNGYFVKKLGALDDGRYFCTVEDGMNDDFGIVLLTRTRSEEAPKRENMVLASVGGGGDLTALAVRFSRNSDQYHLTVKNYNSLTDLYNALLAKEAIDIIDLSGVDVEKLSKQGVFADLTPYLEQSEIIGPSDFLEGILDTYTFDGTLVGIPESFTLQTVVGDRTLLGGDTGLSLEGMLGAVGRNPGALPFDEMTKEELMQYILMFNEETFIDWDTGQCHFDSEQFRAVLELSSCLPGGDTDNRQSGYGSEVSLPVKIQNGQVLFAIADLYYIDCYQLYEGIFGENAACLGLPTPDGRGGTLLFPYDAYGIVAASEHKSGAWEFIEDVLTQVDVDGMEKEEVRMAYLLPSRFPALKKTLNIIIEYRKETDSQTPEGRYHSIIYEDGWRFQYHAITQEEIDVITNLLKEATPAFSVENDDIINIINEEAAAYYSGQKKVEDVVKIIQNRVQLYVSENS